MYYVYVIYNADKNKIYIGYTDDLGKRLKRHNKLLPSKSSSYTIKNSGKWVLAHQEEKSSRVEAVIREKQLKSYRGRKFIWGKINKNK